MIGVDTETCPIVDGAVPPLVVLSVDGELTHARDVGLRELQATLEQPCTFAEAAFDLSVFLAHNPRCAPDVFAALAEDRVHDVLLRQRLLDIRDGLRRPKHGLQATAEIYGLHKDGSDDWRMRYGELVHTPLCQWPEAAHRYASHDSIVTLEVHRAQDKEDRCGVFRDQHRQVRAAMALKLSGQFGMAVDQSAVAAFAADLERQWVENRELLRANGLIRPNGTRNTLAARERARKMRRVTPGGAPSLSRLDCEESGDAVLVAWARDVSLQKLLTTYVAALRKSPRLRPSYVSLVETGRTSCRSPNIQNLPREPGVRECLVADPGCALVSVDVDKAELVCLSQVLVDWFGKSKMADAINTGRDLHVDVASTILGVDYDAAMARYKSGDEQVASTRQLAKPANFGFPVGMSAKTFVAFAATQGIQISIRQAETLRRGFFRTWPEIQSYLRLIKQKLNSSSRQVHPRSYRIRGGLGFCDFANGYFQGLCADAMKAVLWELACEHYVGKGLLSQCRTVAFVHDEVIVQVPLDAAHEAAKLIQDTVTSVFARWTPDVKVTAGAVAMRRWSKKAKAVFENGRLQVWEG